MASARLVSIWLAFFVCTATAAADTRQIAFRGGDGAGITGLLFTPSVEGRRPAVVALHGCGGLGGRGEPLSPRHADWARRLSDAGILVLFPDSFTSRGFPNGVCRQRNARVTTATRAGDAIAAGRWLAARADVDPRRIAVLGWSQGGTVALAIAGRSGSPIDQVVAFYPGCRGFAASTTWTRRLPLTILHGEADDWTPIAPCRDLAVRSGATLHAFPGAYHGFDAPNDPIRQLAGMAFSARGDGIVTNGTDPTARAAALSIVMPMLARR